MSEKYLFISKKKANKKNPFKLSFEALCYYKGLAALCAKTNHSTTFKTQLFFHNFKISAGMILGNIALFRLRFCKRNNLILRHTLHYSNVRKFQIDQASRIRSRDAKETFTSENLKN